MSDTIQKKDEPKIIDSSTGQPLSRSRRRFLAHSGMYTAGLVGSALLGACSDDNNDAVAQTGGNGSSDTVDFSGAPSDAAVLEFALNLEYLEAEFYLRALTGKGLQDDDIGGGGMSAGDVNVPAGGTKVDFSSDQFIGRYAAEITADELHHVQFLRSALKGANGLISRPALNLDTSFTAAAKAALMGAKITPDSDFTFNPFSSPTAFLLGAFIFEDVGVTAYKGGAQYIRNRDYLTAAAGILSVEGYHAGLIRTLLTQRQDQPALTVGGTTLTVGQVVNAISDARDSLDGDSDLDQGITGDNYDSVQIYGNSYDSTNIVPVSKTTGITFTRTVPQVHNIVYLTQMQVSPQSGDVPDTAFFPKGTRIPAEAALQVSGDNTSSS